jgi:chemotaxis protein MotA
MFVLIGVLIVVVAVVGGYLMEHGNLLVLFQPAELVIIGGAAAGALLIANPIHTLKAIAAAIPKLLKAEPYGKAAYTELMKLLHDLFAAARKMGAARLEADIEQPDQSPVFAEFPRFLKDQKALNYLRDSIRVFLMGGVSVHEIESMMELDSEVQAHEAAEPVHALQSMADALPGLGIVAAVLGVVITMGALGGPAGEIGHKVAAALVGTFLGILLCYGFIGPVSARLARMNEAEEQYFVCLRNGVLAYVRGCGPLLAAEFARRSVPPHLRPTFQEMEQLCKGTSASAPAAETAQAA